MISGRDGRFSGQVQKCVANLSGIPGRRERERERECLLREGLMSEVVLLGTIIIELASFPSEFVNLSSTCSIRLGGLASLDRL